MSHAPASRSISPLSLPREAAYTAAVAAGVAVFCATFLLSDPGFFWHDDFQTVFLPNYRDIARSLQDGCFPLRSPYSWHGGALGGEYQYGIFSVWMLSCLVGVFALGLSLPLTAASLSIVHLAILAGGAFRLARCRGLNVAEGLLAALVGSLNGWVFIWGAMNWFGHLAALAWLPWAWWALERAVSRPEGACRFLPAAVFLYLILTAGWPWAVGMAGMVSLWLVLRNGFSRRGLARLWPLAAAWAVGLGLSAPAWLMLLEYTQQTLRGQTLAGQFTNEWVVPLDALPGLIFPAFLTEWNVFAYGATAHRCLELTGGLAPIVLTALALRRQGRAFLHRAGWELGLASVLLLLSVCPGLGNFRWSFRWLPFFFLALGLVGGQALALLRLCRDSGAARTNAGMWATAAVLLVWTTTLWRGPAHDSFALGYALFLLSCCLAWGWLERMQLRRGAWHGAWPCLVTLACCWVGYCRPNHYLCVPTWPIAAKSFPNRLLDPDIRYFSTYRTVDIWDGFQRGDGSDLQPGNFALYSSMHLVNGYSPMRLAGLSELFGFEAHGEVRERDARRLLSRETDDEGLLAFLGVEGLILSRHFESFVPELEQRGWRVTASTAQALVLHRQGAASPRVRIFSDVERSSDRRNILRRLRDRTEGPLPLVLSADDPADQPLVLGRAEVRVSTEERNCLTIEVSHGSPERPVLVAVAQPWYPGYTARFNGRPLPVHVLDLIVPAVLLPPGAQGQLILEYRPASLVYGRAIVLGTLLGVFVFVAIALGQKLASRVATRRVLLEVVSKP